MAWTIEFSATAIRHLKKSPATRARRIDRFLHERLAVLDDPRTLGKALQGPLGSYWSYRVGDDRVICDLIDRRLTVLVLKVGDRKDVYR